MGNVERRRREVAGETVVESPRDAGAAVKAVAVAPAAVLGRGAGGRLRAGDVPARLWRHAGGQADALSLARSGPGARGARGDGRYARRADARDHRPEPP